MNKCPEFVGALVRFLGLEAGGVGVGVVAEGGDDEVVEDADVEGFAGGFDAAGEGVVLD